MQDAALQQDAAGEWMESSDPAAGALGHAASAVWSGPIVVLQCHAVAPGAAALRLPGNRFRHHRSTP